MIKVCHISTVHGAFDGRIFYKECTSLAKAGFEVYLVVTHDKTEIVNGVHIIPLKPVNGRLKRIFLKSFSALNKALKTKAKLYHFHDPELIFIGLILRLLGKKVIFDSHENVSKQITSKQWIGNAFIRSFIAFIYRKIEQFGIFCFNGVISVTPEIVEYLSSKKGILIRNYPIIKTIEQAPPKAKSDVPSLIYVGGLTKIRGIKEICEAVALINQPIQLTLLGPWESEQFKTECISIAPDKTTYLGILPMDKVYSFIKSADIGLATLYPEKNYLNSLPIKAFEYMACEVPIIMSDFPYWKEKFGSSALFVNPNKTEEIKEAILKLINDKDLSHKLSNHSLKQVKEMFSWEAEAKTLVKLYHEILDI